MFSWMWIFGIVVLPGRAQTPDPNITTCEEFERGARFNPYEVIDSMWKIIYFWADNTELSPIKFSLVAKTRLFKFREQIEAIAPELDPEWNKATLFMNPRPGTEVLFLYQGTPGAFRAIIKKEQRSDKVRPYPVPLIKLADVRFKFMERYLGMMCCEDFSAYVLARMTQIPETELQCALIAKKLGFRGPNGQSYFELKRKFDEL